MVQKVPVMVVQDPKKIEVFNEPTRKQILRLLSDKEMTLTKVARKLGLSKRSIAYHLRILLKENLIELTNKRVNEYGIQEKFYRSKASVLLGDFEKSPKRVREETLESNRDTVIGYLCAKSTTKLVSDEKLEQMVKSFTRMVQKISEEDGKIGDTRNQTKMAIYMEAFRRLEKKEQWRTILRTENNLSKPPQIAKH